ncbi:protein IQ-DOMAIN 14-like [Triticum dicoccoides]|uniref:protein IQ-DOMAIN 14-like n=1 Tax=Triticum dicoccoides TaxID=85692 RepID=UPI00188EC667|nr:protein IQ-DOMAIN 14-like [Triticum dicoccoides]
MSPESAAGKPRQMPGGPPPTHSSSSPAPPASAVSPPRAAHPRARSARSSRARASPRNRADAPCLCGLHRTLPPAPPSPTASTPSPEHPWSSSSPLPSSRFPLYPPRSREGIPRDCSIPTARRKPHDRPRHLSFFSGSRVGKRPAGPALFLASSLSNHNNSFHGCVARRRPPQAQRHRIWRIRASLAFPCPSPASLLRRSPSRASVASSSAAGPLCFCRTEGDARSLPASRIWASQRQVGPASAPLDVCLYHLLSRWAKAHGCFSR